MPFRLWQREHKTPHIAALAASGLRFDNASQPLCTPSRVQITTGIHNNRNYLNFGTLDPKATTFANHLRDAGHKLHSDGRFFDPKTPEEAIALVS